MSTHCKDCGKQIEEGEGREGGDQCTYCEGFDLAWAAAQEADSE